MVAAILAAVPWIPKVVAAPFSVSKVHFTVRPFAIKLAAQTIPLVTLVMSNGHVTLATFFQSPGTVRVAWVTILTRESLLRVIGFVIATIATSLAIRQVVHRRIQVSWQALNVRKAVPAIASYIGRTIRSAARQTVRWRVLPLIAVIREPIDGPRSANIRFLRFGCFRRIGVQWNCAFEFRRRFRRRRRLRHFSRRCWNCGSGGTGCSSRNSCIYCNGCWNNSWNWNGNGSWRFWNT